VKCRRAWLILNSSDVDWNILQGVRRLEVGSIDWVYPDLNPPRYPGLEGKTVEQIKDQLAYFKGAPRAGDFPAKVPKRTESTCALRTRAATSANRSPQGQEQSTAAHHALSPVFAGIPLRRAIAINNLRLKASHADAVQLSCYPFVLSNQSILNRLRLPFTPRNSTEVLLPKKDEIITLSSFEFFLVTVHRALFCSFSRL
jgi:hypothetical protein